MSKKILLEVDDANNLVDANGYIFYGGMNSVAYAPFEIESGKSDKTVELVKLGVSVDEIIKLKNMDLI